MPQDSLNGQITHSKPMQIRCQTPPECMPAMPLWESLIAFVLVIRPGMLGLGLAAQLADIDRWQNDALQRVVRVRRFARLVRKHRAGNGIFLPLPMRCQFGRQSSNNRNWSFALLAFRFGRDAVPGSSTFAQTIIPTDADQK
jgi:hypothetical protein